MSETKARRRIRLAVESRGFTLESLEWEPAYNAGEMMGAGGGWYGTTMEQIWPNTFPGNDFGGLSVDEVLAEIDASLAPPEPCGCVRPKHFTPMNVLKGQPSRIGVHDADCKWHIDYHLRWWTEHGTDWSDWKPLGSWAESNAQKPRCACGFPGTPEECEQSRTPTTPKETTP